MQYELHEGDRWPNLTSSSAIEENYMLMDAGREQASYASLDLLLREKISQVKSSQVKSRQIYLYSTFHVQNNSKCFT